MRIAIFEVGPREAEAFDVLKDEHDLSVTRQALPDGKCSKLGRRVVSTFVYSNVDYDVLRQLPAIRLIATCSTGYEHIDVESCFGRRITV